MYRTIASVALGGLVTAGAGPGGAEAPKKGGVLAFAVVAEPPNNDCHANTSFAFVLPSPRTIRRC